MLLPSSPQVINSCEKSADWSAALQVLDDMKAAGVRPNVVCYNAAISACEKARQCDRALELLEELEHLLHTLPDVISYNAAISACEKGFPPVCFPFCFWLKSRQVPLPTWDQPTQV